MHSKRVEETIVKRNVLFFSFAIFCAFMWGPAAAFPDRSVRLVVPFPPGSSLDKVARLVATRLAVELKQPVVVDNVSGAGGTIGADAVLAAPRDGHTLLLGTLGVLAINPHIYKQLKHDPLKDFLPIGTLTRTSNVLAVRNGLPVNNVVELIAHAKANPGKLNYGSAGVGSSSHLGGAMLASMTGIQLVHVPYRGAAAAVTDLISGQIDILMDAAATYVPLAKSGRVKVLGLTSRSQFVGFPSEWQSLHDAGVPGFDVTVWNGIVAPAGTPAAHLEVLRLALHNVMSAPTITATLAPDEAMRTTHQEFESLIRREHARWGTLVKESGASASQ